MENIENITIETPQETELSTLAKLELLERKNIENRESNEMSIGKMSFLINLYGRAIFYTHLMVYIIHISLFALIFLSIPIAYLFQTIYYKQDSLLGYLKIVSIGGIIMLAHTSIYFMNIKWKNMYIYTEFFIIEKTFIHIAIIFSFIIITGFMCLGFYYSNPLSNKRMLLGMLACVSFAKILTTIIEIIEVLVIVFCRNIFKDALFNMKTENSRYRETCFVIIIGLLAFMFLWGFYLLFCKKISTIQRRIILKNGYDDFSPIYNQICGSMLTP
ncbi:hypothetical protein NEIG_00563 [Nematocida sp. ERTm5]|nr:hypothetical protein NEIG_00563 [Nematocida sp. ERTm5]